MKLLLAVLTLLSLARAAEPATVLLWPNGAPGAQGDAEWDRPSVTPYLAANNPAGTAVIVFPGGGYVHLADNHEGVQIAAWLNAHGLTAFVVRYRLGPRYRNPMQFQDAQRAIRWVRANAADFHIHSDHVGIWGFSAGGHLASTLGTHFEGSHTKASDPVDAQNDRPDFMVLAYPVITMKSPYVHTGSRQALLGASPDAEIINFLSNETQVTAKTPPTFLFHTENDDVVPVENSLLFYSALRQAGVPAEIHIYLKGAHGVGLAQTDPVLKSWPDRLLDWLRIQNLL